MNTRTYILSSTTLAAGISGDAVYDIGPTNLVVSFSGVNVSGKYLKFFVEYSDDSQIYIVQNPTNLFNVKDQTISRTFYPSTYRTANYTIDVSGVKTNLDIDLYRINLSIGQAPIANTYKDIKIVSSHLYTNAEGSNYLFLTLEAQSPRYVGNVVIPYNKDRKVYLPGPPLIFVPNDNNILRAEIWTYFGGPSGGAYMPIVTENTWREIVEERQYVYKYISTEFGTNTYVYDGEYPVRLHNTGGQSSSLDINGEETDDYLVLIPEDGIDYLDALGVPDTENFDVPYEPNKYISFIYPGGILPK